MRLVVMIVSYAFIAAIVWVFVGTAIPPCFGRVPDGRISQACVDVWIANRSFVEWLLATPYPEIAGFLAASALTIWLHGRRRARR